MITIYCKTCGKPFNVPPSQANRINCSVECANKAKTGKALHEHTCKNCGNVFTSLYRLSSKKAPKYCSHQCYNRHRTKKRIKDTHKICLTCGSVFYPDRDTTRFCSLQCFGLWRRQGDKRTCKNCGQVFYVRSSHNDQFCNRRCYREYTKPGRNRTCIHCGKIFDPSNNPKSRLFCSQRCFFLNKKNGVVKKCLNCNEDFYVCNSHRDTRFCTRRCRLIYKGPTTIEELLINEFDNRNIKYEFQYQLGRFVIDFAFPDCKLAVEADGIYWHNLPANKKRDKNKNEFLNKNGWSIVRLSEPDIIKSPGKCVEKIITILEGQ